MIRPNALFLDIDGTILIPGKSPSRRMVKAISALKNRGTLICLSSGRNWEALKPIYDNLGLDGPAICYNGAWIVESVSGRCLFESLLEEDVARYAVNLARKRDVTFLAYRDSHLLYEKEGREIEAYKQRIQLPSTRLNFDDIEPLRFTKAIFINQPEELKMVDRDLKKPLPPGK